MKMLRDLAARCAAPHPARPPTRGRRVQGRRVQGRVGPDPTLTRRRACSCCSMGTASPRRSVARSWACRTTNSVPCPTCSPSTTAACAPASSPSPVRAPLALPHLSRHPALRTGMLSAGRQCEIFPSRSAPAPCRRVPRAPTCTRGPRAHGRAPRRGHLAEPGLAAGARRGPRAPAPGRGRHPGRHQRPHPARAPAGAAPARPSRRGRRRAPRGLQRTRRRGRGRHATNAPQAHVFRHPLEIITRETAEWKIACGSPIFAAATAAAAGANCQPCERNPDPNLMSLGLARAAGPGRRRGRERVHRGGRAAGRAARVRAGASRARGRAGAHAARRPRPRLARQDDALVAVQARPAAHLGRCRSGAVHDERRAVGRGRSRASRMC